MGEERPGAIVAYAAGALVVSALAYWTWKYGGGPWAAVMYCGGMMAVMGGLAWSRDR